MKPDPCWANSPAAIGFGIRGGALAGAAPLGQLCLTKPGYISTGLLNCPIKRIRMMNLPAGNHPPGIAVLSLQINPVSPVATVLCRVAVKNCPLHTIRALNNPGNLAVDCATARAGTKWRSVNIPLLRLCAASRAMSTTRRFVWLWFPPNRTGRQPPRQHAHLLLIHFDAANRTGGALGSAGMFCKGHGLCA